MKLIHKEKNNILNFQPTLSSLWHINSQKVQNSYHSYLQVEVQGTPGGALIYWLLPSVKHTVTAQSPVNAAAKTRQ